MKNIKTEADKGVTKKPAVYVDVVRSEEIQATRLKLPILGEEQQIMEVINENSVVILAGNEVVFIIMVYTFQFFKYGNFLLNFFRVQSYTHFDKAYRSFWTQV